MTGGRPVPDAAIWITRLEPGVGMPVAVKDLFDTAGVRTTYGSAIFRDHVPLRTAEAVRLLESAGYAAAGKANLHEFAYGITSQNPHFGDVLNPLDESRDAGGSSSGSAAAVVTGLAAAGLGTDSGGSIRIPAACCGIAGFKPTWGVVPMDGCFPLAPSFDHAGPLAADVDGCTRMMRALAPATGHPPPVELGELEVGVAWLARADAGVAARVRDASSLFGARRAVDAPKAKDVGPGFRREIGDTHHTLFAEHRQLYGANVARKIEQCLATADSDAEAARRARERCREQMDELLDQVDLLVTPTLPLVAPPANSEEIAIRDRMTEFTFPFNATGCPALALPCGPAEHGLPASIQLVGRRGEDDFVLAAGAALEQALRG